MTTSISTGLSEQSASFVTDIVIRYLQGRADVEQLLFRCDSHLNRPMTTDEFRAIASLAASYGYKFDVDAVCSEIERKKQISLLKSDLKILFTGIAPATVLYDAKGIAVGFVKE